MEVGKEFEVEAMANGAKGTLDGKRKRLQKNGSRYHV